MVQRESLLALSSAEHAWHTRFTNLEGFVDAQRCGCCICMAQTGEPRVTHMLTKSPQVISSFDQQNKLLLPYYFGMNRVYARIVSEAYNIPQDC